MNKRPSMGLIPVGEVFPGKTTWGLFTLICFFQAAWSNPWRHTQALFSPGLEDSIHVLDVHECLVTPKFLPPALACLSPVRCSDSRPHQDTIDPLWLRWNDLPLKHLALYRVPISLNGTSIYPVPKTRRPGTILKIPSPSGLYPTVFSPVTFNLNTSFSSPPSLPSSQPRRLQALAGPPLESPNWSSYITIWPSPSSSSPHSCQGILPRGLSDQIWT